MEKNILLEIKYDGRDFHGWQIQPDKRTVQGEIEKALSELAKEKISIDGTGRTDSGVHALGQMATFKWSLNLPTDKLPFVLNNMFSGGKNTFDKSGDIHIVSAKEVESDFHARFNSKGKTYRYVIDNSNKIDIFRRNYAYLITEELDVEMMKKAAENFIGKMDFKSFEASGGNPRETTVRTISNLTVEKTKDDILIDVTGDGFLYNMVRIIIGTLVEVGKGKRKPEEVKEIIEAKNRTAAGHTAPPQGLYLMRVYY